MCAVQRAESWQAAQPGRRAACVHPEIDSSGGIARRRGVACFIGSHQTAVLCAPFWSPLGFRPAEARPCPAAAGRAYMRTGCMAGGRQQGRAMSMAPALAGGLHTMQAALQLGNTLHRHHRVVGPPARAAAWATRASECKWRKNGSHCKFPTQAGPPAPQRCRPPGRTAAAGR